MKDSVIDLAQRLIEIPSVSERTGELGRVFDLVEEELRGYPVVVKRFESGGKPSLVVTLADVKEPDIFLNGHLDVVAGKDSSFKPYIEGDRLYGRGAYDMKTACAVMIQLMKDLSRTSIAGDRVGLMLVSDEELGGFDGSGYLLRQGYKPKELLVAGEGTNFNIAYESKGALSLKLIARGKATHGAYPWRGSNAIFRLVNALSALSKLYPTPVEEKWETTHVATKFSGGESINQVPGYAEASLDIRYVSEDSPDTIIQRLKSVFEEEIEVELILHEEAHVAAETDTFLVRLANLTQLVIGKEPKMIKHHGSSDARFFTRVNVAACEFGLAGKNHHQDDEYVELESLPQYYAILDNLVKGVGREVSKNMSNFKFQMKEEDVF